MMVSVETYLLRMRRRADRMGQIPGLRAAGAGAAAFGGGFLLSGVRVWGQMQPAAMSLTLGLPGWRRVGAALGSAVGCRLFWGREGWQGAVWAMGALVLSVLLPLLAQGNRLRLLRAVGAACVVSAAGLAFRLLGEQPQPELFFLRILLAALCGYAAEEMMNGKKRVARWFLGALTVLTLAGFHPLLGQTAAGLTVTAFPLPMAMLAGLAADLGAGDAVSVTAVTCIVFFLQRMGGRELWKRTLYPAASAGLWMLLNRAFAPGMLAAYALGGAAGCFFPPRFRLLPRRDRVGAAQVRLEQTARVLQQFQRQLLEYVPPKPDPEALAETLRRIKACRAAREEYRMALVQQYGCLADVLRSMSDALPGRNPPRPRYRVQISSRSRSREASDGDHVLAFPGLGCRFYVVLCDGMGTGMGAAEESRTASNLIRQMLTAGLPPESVLGSVNSQLALTDRGGAVTVDLAEIRMDSGRVRLYKWGAGPSWLLRGSRSERIGAPGPPPGLGVCEGRESVARTVLTRGETLVMASDGIDPSTLPTWPDQPTPSALADHILAASPTTDDATAVVIRLVKVNA